MAIPKVMGTEIEYGITVKGDPDFDPISSCVLLVNAYREDHAGEILWDYDQENPLADARGFTVDGEKYTPNQQENIARNKTLINGARYYVDHAHPEYSCPEVTNPRDLVIHEKAGERIIEASRREANALLPAGMQMLLYKNNSDRKGNSLRSPRELSHGPSHLLQAGGGAPDALLRDQADLLWGRQGGQREPQPALRLSDLPAGRLFRDRGRPRHDGEAADHKHPGRAPRRPREVPAAARDRGRCESLRVHDLPAPGRHDPRALDDRRRRHRPQPLVARSGARHQGGFSRSELSRRAGNGERETLDCRAGPAGVSDARAKSTWRVAPARNGSAISSANGRQRSTHSSEIQWNSQRRSTG